MEVAMTQLLTPGPDVDTSQVPFAITDRSWIPRERYYDKAFFDIEIEKLWPHAWQMACRLEEIPNVGDYAEYWVGPYSVLVVRTSSTEIKAYQNACRHRATQLAVGCGQFRGGQIVCPFHGWRWNLDGTPSALYGREGFEERMLDPEDLKLIECQVDTWANCVFINMDRDAPSLMEALDPMPSILDPLNVGKMRVYWWKAVRLKANWKLAMEAFMEGWHVMQTHPQLTMGIGERYRTDNVDYISLPNGHMRFDAKEQDVAADAGYDAGLAEADAMLASLKLLWEGLDAMTLAKDVHVLESLRNAPFEPGHFAEKMIEAIYTWNVNAGVPFPPPSEAYRRWGAVHYIFPNYFILPQFGNALIYRSRPDSEDPEHCFFELWSVTLYPEGQEPGKPTLAGVFEKDDAIEWPLIPRQDFSNIERQQRGLHTPGFRAMRLADTYENGIANMHAHLDAYLAR
jgi:phenylpropionate dioxygenase-like ring-hydroxylating dioxygenase large terminal subunit